MARLLLSVLIALALVAASGSGADAAKRYRVALVVDQAADTPVTRLYDAGLRGAGRDLDVEVRIVVQPLRTSFTSTFRGLARQGYDLIISGTFAPTAAMAAARSNPETRFALPDIRSEETGVALPPNVAAFGFREEEIGFVVGYLAGLVERLRPGPDAVGSVGGVKFPPVDRFIAGYRAGARRASPRIRHVNRYAGTFIDPESCKRVAAAQIAKGVGVVSTVAGGCGLGALAAAKQHGIWGIGVDQDQSALGAHVLTSAVKRFDIVVYRTIELLVRGRFETGRDTLLGLREGVLGLGKVSPRVPRSLVERTLRIEKQIESGAITGIPTTLGD